MSNKFKEGDVVYIRKDIEAVCRDRYNKGIFTDTIPEMYAFAGRQYKIVEVYSRYGESYDGGSYVLYDIKKDQCSRYAWYDFHLIPVCECIDVNEVIK